jgi:hypothetical protein
VIKNTNKDKSQANYQLVAINSQKPFYVYENIYINQQPDTCPLCQTKITPKFIYSQINPANENAEIVYQCPYLACGKLFLTYFENQKTKGQLSKFLFHFLYSKPSTYTSKHFSQEINNISNEFVIVYNQACEAENLGLDRIAGVGYRKALEFLIKDYCIYKSPKEADAIKKDLLMKVIKERISDEEIELIAERATWLGNDKTHYVRTWQNRDIHDLKEMIDIVQEFITKKIKFKKLLESMPEKKE